MKYFDIETREIVTEEQLRETFEALKAEQPEEYDFDFKVYRNNCTSKNGTLVPVYEETKPFSLPELVVCPKTIECGLWSIERTLLWKYGTQQAKQDMAPLSWYISTGRASVDFIRRLLYAKPFMVARKLHKGGSYDEVIERVKQYIMKE